MRNTSYSPKIGWAKYKRPKEDQEKIDRFIEEHGVTKLDPDPRLLEDFLLEENYLED